MRQDDAAIVGTLTEIIRDILLRDEITRTPGTAARDVPGWDSLRHIEILVAVETHYHIRFRSSGIDAIRSVGDMMRAIRATASCAR